MSLGLSWVRFDFTALKVPAASIDHCPKLQAAHGEGLCKGQGRRQAHRGGARKKERERERERAGARYRVLIDFFNQRKVPTMTGPGLPNTRPRPYRSSNQLPTPVLSLSMRHTHIHTHFSLLSQFHRVFYSSLSRFSPSTFLTKRSAHYHHHYPHRLRLPISSPPSATSSSSPRPSPSCSLSALGTHS